MLIKARSRQISLFMVLTMLLTMFIGIGTGSAATDYIEGGNGTELPTSQVVNTGQSASVPTNVDEVYQIPSIIGGTNMPIENPYVIENMTENRDVEVFEQASVVKSGNYTYTVINETAKTALLIRIAGASGAVVIPGVIDGIR